MNALSVATQRHPRTTAKSPANTGACCYFTLRRTLVSSGAGIGKIIRIDTKAIRAAGRATMGVKLLDLDDADKVAAAVTIPNDEKSEEDKPLVTPEQLEREPNTKAA